MKTTNEYLRLLRDYKREHAAEYGIERMGIFGSVARGEQMGDSDIDIYYEGPSMGLKSLVRLPRELEAFLGAPVDVTRRHNNLQPHFVERIMKDIIYV
ncbi:MAG: nucleotidyltransferase domain-containing protein [Prevotellaceae bacterium]|jgi:predicted nucleotidyltransferase|nr:nucleotidyltransferase domain-containing protein [Prevotellaceae bacterium]